MDDLFGKDEEKNESQSHCGFCYLEEDIAEKVQSARVAVTINCNYPKLIKYKESQCDADNLPLQVTTFFQDFNSQDTIRPIDIALWDNNSDSMQIKAKVPAHGQEIRFVYKIYQLDIDENVWRELDMVTSNWFFSVSHSKFATAKRRDFGKKKKANKVK